MANDPLAIQAVSASQDERLVQHLVEYIALGTWAGKPFVMPAHLRTPYARTRLRTLFSSPNAIDRSLAERVLLSDLHDARLPIRETAAYLLGIMGSTAAVPQLIPILHDPSPTMRMQAAKALGRSGSSAAVTALLAALRGADEPQSSQIFQALVNLGPLAVPSLLETSQSNSNWMRWHSIRALCEIRDQRALPRLVQALNDPDHGVAWMAAKGLAHMGKECVAPVLHLLISAETTPWLVETASYVLNTQFTNHKELKPDLEPVVQQMHQSAFRVGTGSAALKALEHLETSQLLPRH